MWKYILFFLIGILILGLTFANVRDKTKYLVKGILYFVYSILVVVEAILTGSSSAYQVTLLLIALTEAADNVVMFFKNRKESK